MIQFAAQQLIQYRDVLLANTTESWKGLWVHIVGPQSQTLGIWCTGNGWAALGMARVLATIKHYPKARGKFPREEKELVNTMMSMFNGLKGVNVSVEYHQRNKKQDTVLKRKASDSSATIPRDSCETISLVMFKVKIQEM